MRWLILLLLLSCAVETMPETRKEPMDIPPDITVEQAVEMDAIILDVRTPKEYAAGHLEGAVNIDYYDEDFEEQLLAVVEKNKRYIIYCKSGRRSSKTLDLLEGYDVHNMLGGYEAWVAAGQPVVN